MEQVPEKHKNFLPDEQEGGIAMPHELRQLLHRRLHALMSLPNVVGVGVGYKRRNGHATSNLGVVVLVKKKLPLENLSATAAVPQSVEGVPTDVIEVGEIWALGANPHMAQLESAPPERITRVRPAQPGVSIGHYQVTAGTFGAVVQDRKTKEPLILSNNHVLANSTTGRDNKAQVGDPIWQPGKYDGGSENDTIAMLDRYVPLKFKRRMRLFPTFFNTRMNLVDAAVARPTSAEMVKPEILGLGPVKGLVEPKIDMEIVKSGRTTGITRSRILALHTTLEVGYDVEKKAIFTEQIVAEAMSAGGDSGSLVLDNNNQAVGLLFAGSTQSSIITPIQTVLDHLAVDLVTGT